MSQIERGQSRPSVSTLFALAEALEVPVDAFFRDGAADAGGAASTGREAGLDAVTPDAAVPRAVPGAVAAAVPPPTGHDRFVTWKSDRAAIEIEGGVRWERLTPTALPNVEFMELVYGPHAESNPELYRHPGTEMVTVVDGRLDIHVGFDRYELGPGDSICFPSAFPHRYVNPSEQTTRAITVILLAAGSDPLNHRRP